MVMRLAARRGVFLRTSCRQGVCRGLGGRGGRVGSFPWEVWCEGDVFLPVSKHKTSARQCHARKNSMPSNTHPFLNSTLIHRHISHSTVRLSTKGFIVVRRIIDAPYDASLRGSSCLQVDGVVVGGELPRSDETTFVSRHSPIHAHHSTCTSWKRQLGRVTSGIANANETTTSKQGVAPAQARCAYVTDGWTRRVNTWVTHEKETCSCLTRCMGTSHSDTNPLE